MKNEYDLLKALTILLVVVGHVTNHYSDRFSTLVTTAIYLFHMPLFVAISGAVYELGCKNGKYGEFLPFVKNKFMRIVLPFVVVACLFLAPTLVLFGLSKMNYGLTVLNILSGGTCVKHLWYLQALFWIFILAWSLRRLHIKLFSLFCVSVMVAVVRSEMDVSCPFGIGMCIEYFPMFIVGMLLAEGERANDKRRLCVGGALMIIFAVIQKCGQVHLVDNIMRFLLPASIIVFAHGISRFALPELKDSRVLQFVLRQSFGIYLFHMIFIYVLRAWCCESWPAWLAIPATIAFAVGGSIAMTLAIRWMRLEWMIGERRGYVLANQIAVGDKQC